MNLQHLRVLMTRPAGTAQHLTSVLEEQGAQVSALPLMAIQPLANLDVARQFILDLDNYAAVVAISVNAAKQGLALIDQYWPQLPVRQQWFAIGAATARELQRFDIEPFGGDGAMNSEGLLAHAAWDALFAEQAQPKVLILRGVGGRETLAHALLERGAQVDYCELYQRVMPEYAKGVLRDTVASAGVNCIIASSGETVAAARSLAQGEGFDDFFAIPIVVPGARVAELARQAGFSQVVESENAGAEAVMSALKQIA